MSTTHPIAGATFTWLHRETFDDALVILADHGLSHVEIATSPPHLQCTSFDAYERHRLVRRLDELGIAPLSVNPSGLDLNPISMHSDVRDLTERLLREEVRLAADIDAQFVVVGTGRIHPLAPVPLAEAYAILAATYRRVAEYAGTLGVALVVETLPYGFLNTSTELAGFVEDVGSEHLLIAYDVANVLEFEDPCRGLTNVRSQLGLVHVSDATRGNWRHASPGHGEIDFAAVNRTLREIGYTMPTVFELVDERLPTPTYAADIDTLVAAGWTR